MPTLGKKFIPFRVPGLRVHGLAWADDGTLWVADTSAGTINRLDPEDGRIWEVVRVEAPTEVHGLTIHEGVLWYCDAATRAIGQLYTYRQKGIPLKITEVKTAEVRVNRYHYHYVRIHTDEGIYGTGEASHVDGGWRGLHPDHGCPAYRQGPARCRCAF